MQFCAWYECELVQLLSLNNADLINTNPPERIWFNALTVLNKPNLTAEIHLNLVSLPSSFVTHPSVQSPMTCEHFSLISSLLVNNSYFQTEKKHAAWALSSTLPPSVLSKIPRNISQPAQTSLTFPLWTSLITPFPTSTSSNSYPNPNPEKKSLMQCYEMFLFFIVA
jgi:hypothetical protein